MPRENSTVRYLLNLTDDEAVTLRRVAFGESVVRALRRADLDRLLKLRLIEEFKNGMRLTASGKEHLDALPRSGFSDVRPRKDVPASSPPPLSRAKLPR